jgi:hypothetical protein
VCTIYNSKKDENKHKERIKMQNKHADYKMKHIIGRKER